MHLDYLGNVFTHALTNHSKRRLSTKHVIWDPSDPKKPTNRTRGTGMASEIEKRKYPRASIRWPVSITTSNGSVRGLTEDISPEGFSIHLEKPLELFEPITITTIVSTSGHILEVTGEVLWSDDQSSDDENTLLSIGVRFLSISYADKVAIGIAVFNQHIAERRNPANFSNLRALVVWGSSRP